MRKIHSGGRSTDTLLDPAYAAQVLHLSEHAAYGRIEAPRAAGRFPVLLELLADGSINLTTVGLLAAHLTPENHRQILDEVRHQPKRAVEEIVARLRPKPDVPSSVRKLPGGGPVRGARFSRIPSRHAVCGRRRRDD